jgi:CBS domain-containing protein
MLRELPVSDLMTVDVMTFDRDLNVRDAMRRLVDRGVGGAPVVDPDGKVVGVVTTADFIVEEARLHVPTFFNFFGVNVALPWHDKELDESVYKALGEFVGDVMTAEPATVLASATVEDAATLMHDRKVSRLPVVDTTNRLQGVITISDILRAMVRGLGEDDAGEERAGGSSRYQSYDAGDELTEMLGERASSDLDLKAREAHAARLAREQRPSGSTPSDEDDDDYGTDIGNI